MIDGSHKADEVVRLLKEQAAKAQLLADRRKRREAEANACGDCADLKQRLIRACELIDHDKNEASWCDSTGGGFDKRRCSCGRDELVAELLKGIV